MNGVLYGKPLSKKHFEVRNPLFLRGSEDGESKRGLR